VVQAVPAVEHVDHVGSDDERAFLRDPDSEASRSFLAALKPDLFVSLFYGRVLHEDALAIPRIGSINVHPSLLPRYRGLSAPLWALYEGESRIGVTVHEMILPVDAGPILAQDSIEVWARDRPSDLYRRLVEPTARVLRRSLEEIVRTGEIRGRPQIGEASYRSFPWTEYDRLVPDWSLPAAELVRRSRVFEGGTNIPLGARRLFFTRVVESGPTSAPAGTTLRRRPRSWEVAAGDGRSVRLYLARPVRGWMKLAVACLLGALAPRP
jgi:methionyl-tRNA formyltransferase